MKKIKLILVGYGNVGKAFGDILARKSDFIKERYGCESEIVGIATKSKGVLMPGAGDYDKSLSTIDLIKKADYDVMVELTPINIMSGEPAITHIKEAILRKKHVITANKGPIAWAFEEIKALAAKEKVLFLHEATVMDGAPVFNLYYNTLIGCKILSIKGVLNATTNFLLKRMSEGMAIEEAIAEGKKRGFVETDPSMDVDGWDASAKLSALMNVMMGANINPTLIARTGIGDITYEQIKKAKENGKVIKLICEGYIDKDGKPVGRVSPQEVSTDSIYATVSGTAAAVTVSTDLQGDITILQHEFAIEIDQTAYGVLSDLFKVMEFESRV